MGMAAGQARLLSITSRMADNELRAQIINNNKMRLATQSSQASEAYVTALNEAQMMFTNYDANNNASYQKLTYNALTAYNANNNQYIVTNSSGNVLLSEKDAQNYRNANGDVNKFLASYGLEYGTTYFKELDKYYDEANHGIAYKTGLLDEDGREIPGIIGVVPGNTAASAADIAEYIQQLYEGTVPDDTSDPKIHPGYMVAVSSEKYFDYNSKLAAYTAAKDEWLEGIVETMSLYILEKSNNNYGISDNLASSLEFLQNRCKNHDWATCLPDNPDYSISSGIDALVNDDYGLLTYLNLYAYKDEGTDENGQPLQTTNDSYFSYLKRVLEDNAGEYISISDISNTDDFIIEKENVTDNDGILQSSTMKFKNDAGEEFFAIKGTVTSSNTDENGNTSYEFTWQIKGLNLGENETYQNATFEDAEYDRNTKEFILNKDSDNEIRIKFNIQDPGEEHYPTDYFCPGEGLPTDWDINIKKKQSDTERDAVLLEVINLLTDNNYANIFANWDPNNTKFAYSDPNNSIQQAYETASQNLIKTIFGANVVISADYYQYLDDIEECFNGILSDKFSTETAAKNDFQQVYDAYLLDCIMNTYGEPKYAWVDKNNSNENADIKAKWYENLFKRIQNGGYKVLQDGLASSNEWIQFAFESGIITMEQLDSNENWNPLKYRNCSDITEQTNDAAVAKAEAEYKSAMNKIEAKDKRYDMELKNIDTEHNSLQTEYDSIKTAIDKNIERTFKLYS